MDEINLGKVAILPRGEYDSSLIYNRLEFVKKEDKTYLSKIDNNSNDPESLLGWMLVTKDADGTPPYIGANGNWYVGGIDSGVKAEGTSIESVVKTSTSGNVDTYTITYSDSTTSTFNVTNGDNAVSWNFKGTLDAYADLLLVTGMVANDAYLVSEKDVEGTRYLYIYNGVNFPLEFEGLPYGVMDHDKLDALYNNLEVTPEIDVFKDVPVFSDNRYYYSGFPDSDPNSNYHILGPVLLLAGVTYTIDTYLNADNGALRLVWVKYDAVTSANLGLVIDYGQQFTSHVRFEYTPDVDMNVYVSDRKDEPRTKILSRVESEKVFYVEPEQVDKEDKTGVVSMERMKIDTRTNVLLSGQFGFGGFSAGESDIGVVDIYRNTESIGKRSQIIDLQDYDSIQLSVNLTSTLFGVDKFGEDELYRGSIIKGVQTLEDFVYLKEEGIRYLLINTVTERELSQAKLTLIKFNKYSNLSEIDKRITDLENRKVEITNDRSLYITKPNYLKIVFSDDMILPTDTGTIVETGEVTYYDGENVLFRANCKLSVQGNSTATFDKKGYSIDLLNNENQSLGVAFGNWIVSTGFHIKSYQTDTTKIRDVLGNRIWKHLRTNLAYPNCNIDTRPVDFDDTNEQRNFNDKAQYIMDGIPCEIWHRGELQGTYMNRLKKTRENYRMNNNVKSNILLDGGWMSTLQSFDYTKWEVRSPKIAGYSEGMPITDAQVLGDIMRLSTWLDDCIAGTQNFATTAVGYLNVPAWLVFTIWIELVGHADANNNNQLVGTWDRLTWHPFPSDIDTAFGTNAMVAPHLRLTDEAWLINTQPLLLIRAQMWAELRATYSYLRTNKILTEQNLFKMIDDLAGAIPSASNKADLLKWSWFYHASGFTSSTAHIKTYLANRMAWMDTQLL